MGHDLLVELGKRVSTLDRFVEEMLSRAAEAEVDGKLREAGFLYRRAEFFMTPDYPEKADVYKKFMTYFD